MHEKQITIAALCMLALEMAEDLIAETNRIPSAEFSEALKALNYFAEQNNSIISVNMNNKTYKQDFENAVLFHAKKFIQKIK